MSVPKGKRKQSRFEAQHHWFRLRDDVTELMLLDFGFSQEKYARQIEHYREAHRSAEDVNAVVEKFEKKCESFHKWFIDRECDIVLEILRDIECEFTLANSIYPSDTLARLAEFIVRRHHMNKAIGYCYTLKQEINYIIRTLPVDINKFERFGESIDLQISLYKGVRQADNRFMRPKKGEDDPYMEMLENVNGVMRILDERLKRDIKE